jgi:hypothetical protein
VQYRGKSYPFPKAGQMLFIDCSYGEKIDTLGESHILFIHFYGTWVKSYYDIFYEMNGQSPIVPFQSQTVINHIKRIIDIYSKPTAFYEDIVAESLIMECITKLIRSTAPRLSADYSKAVTDCIDMINSEYTGDLSLEKLSENEIVKLDEERKAAMVSNLLVVLCGNRDAQPVVNSGSLY